jgi:hypothetical protein
MFGDWAIASLKLHVTNLALTKILKNAIRSVTVRIAVLKSFLPCNDNHHR